MLHPGPARRSGRCPPERTCHQASRTAQRTRGSRQSRALSEQKTTARCGAVSTNQDTFSQSGSALASRAVFRALAENQAGVLPKFGFRVNERFGVRFVWFISARLAL